MNNETKVAIDCFWIVSSLVGQGMLLFLLYQVLSRVDSTPEMWSAYWIYLPTSIIATALTRVLLNKKS